MSGKENKTFNKLIIKWGKKEGLGTTVEEVLEGALLLRGLSIEKIAEKTGVGRNTIYSRMIKYDLTGTREPGRTRELRFVEDSELYGDTAKNLAERYNVTTRTVYRERQRRNSKSHQWPRFSEETAVEDMEEPGSS